MTFAKQFTETDVLKALTDQPANPAVVAKKIGCSVYTVNPLLNLLYTAGKAQRIEIETLKGISFAWRKIV